MSPGRPRALDDAKRREVCALLTAGFEFHEAARYVGCTAQTISREIRRNPEFRRAVHDALLGSRLAPEKLLRNAAGRNWRAAAWLLERTEPRTYGRNAQSGSTPDDLDAAGRWIIDVALREVAPERRDAAFDRLAAVLRDVKAQFAHRANPKQPIQTPATDFYDLAEMMSQASQRQQDLGILTADGQYSAVKNHANSDAPQPIATSQNPASDGSPSGQNFGIKHAQTCSPRASKSDAPTSAEMAPRRNCRGHAS